MTLTKIFTGMEKGPEAIDANFKALNITDTGWSSAGVVYLNGFGNTGKPFKYRITNLGGVVMLWISGYANDAANKGLDIKNKTAIAKFPSAVVNYVNGSNYNNLSQVGKWVSNGANISIRLDLAGDGTLYAWPMGATKAGFDIDCMFIV